jgi:hypothetical protein
LNVASLGKVPLVILTNVGVRTILSSLSDVHSLAITSIDACTLADMRVHRLELRVPRVSVGTLSLLVVVHEMHDVYLDDVVWPEMHCHSAGLDAC